MIIIIMIIMIMIIIIIVVVVVVVVITIIIIILMHGILMFFTLMAIGKKIQLTLKIKQVFTTESGVKILEKCFFVWRSHYRSLSIV